MKQIETELSKHPMSRICTVFAFALLVTLASTSRAAGGKAHVKDGAKDLLQIAFPSARVMRGKQRGAEHAIGQFNLPDVKWPWLEDSEDHASKPNDVTPVDIDPIDVIRIDGHHSVLVTQAYPAMDERDLCGSYGCQTAIGIYFFTSDENGWRLTQRIDVADSVSAYLAPPLKGRSIKWPQHGMIYSLKPKFCAQGACATQLVLFGLSADRLLYKFGTSIDEDKGADLIINSAQDTVCRDLLDPSFHVPEEETFNVQTCSLASGSWKVAGDSLIFDFHGASREIDGDGHLMPLKTWRSQARVAWRNGKLELVSGKLPEFGV